MKEISIELWVSIGINLLALAFFAGAFVQTQKHLKEAIEKIETGFAEKIKELKEDYAAKIKDLKDDYAAKVQDIKEDLTGKIKELKRNFHEKFESVERKQDKHNNLIERMALCEASTKSAHKREDELSEKVEELEEKYYEHIAKRN